MNSMEQQNKEQLIVKIAFEDTVRLIVLEEPPTIKGVRKLIKEKFGYPASEGDLTYSLPGDDDVITLTEDEDLRLACGLRTWRGAPVKIVATASEPLVGDDAEALNTYEQASKNLVAYDVVAPAAELEKLMDALNFGPRRLVKVGLASPRSLKLHKNNDKGNDDVNDNVNDDVNDDDDQGDGGDWEKVRDISLNDGDDDNRHKGEGEQAEVREMTMDDAATVKAVDNLVSAQAFDGDESSKQKDEDDVVVAALRAKGVSLAAATIHVLLRLLRCCPKRFVKLGMVADMAKARAAYKAGGKDAARAIFKQPGKRVCGWGRGLAGKGKGRGGAFARAGSYVRGFKQHGLKGGRGKGWGKGAASCDDGDVSADTAHPHGSKGGRGKGWAKGWGKSAASYDKGEDAADAAHHHHPSKHHHHPSHYHHHPETAPYHHAHHHGHHGPPSQTGHHGFGSTTNHPPHAGHHGFGSTANQPAQPASPPPYHDDVGDY